MKKLKNVLVTLLSVFVILALFTGCSDNSAEDSDAVGYVSFSESGGSRGLENENSTLYGIEDLYWAYTAEKVRGNYTTGQSEVYTGTFGGSTTDVTDGVVAKSCLDGSTMYKLKAVKTGPSTGLKDAVVGPFSVGEWRIKIYGFKDYDATNHKFTNLIYKGTTGSMWVDQWTGSGAPVPSTAPSVADDIVSIDKRTNPGDGTGDTQARKNIMFNLTGSIGGKAVLEFGPVTLTVPAGQTFFGKEYGGLVSTVDPMVRVLVLDMKNKTSSKPTLIAMSTTTIKFTADTACITEGKPVTTDNTGNALNTLNFVMDSSTHNLAKKTVGSDEVEVNQFDNGVADIAFVVLYKDSSTIGTNSWTQGKLESEWKERYDYTTYDPTYADGTTKTGDIPADLKDWFVAAGALDDPDGATDCGLINGWSLVGNIEAYPIGFTSGVRTTVKGDLNDLLGAKGEQEEVTFDTGVAMITWKPADDPATEPKSKYNPYAQPGTDTVANADFDPDAVGKDFTVFASLEKAIYAYDKYNDKVSTDAPYIKLLAHIEAKDDVKFVGKDKSGTEQVFTTVTDVPVLTGAHFVDGLTIPAGTDVTLTLIPAYTPADSTASTPAKYNEGEYTFTGDNDKDVVLKDFSYDLDAHMAKIFTEAASATAFTDGCVLKIDTKDATDAVKVYHSGVASSVEIADGDGTKMGEDNVMYYLGTRAETGASTSTITSVGTLKVTCGAVGIGGQACVEVLNSCGAADGAVVLKGAADAKVHEYQYNGTSLMKYVATATDCKYQFVIKAESEKLTDTAAKQGGYKEIKLDNAGTAKYIYAVEGIPVALPLFGASSTPAAYECQFTTGADNKFFMNWNTLLTDNLPTGTSYEDKAMFTPSDTDTDNQLKAVIANPVGGRIFSVGTSALGSSAYSFFGADNGKINELTEWKTTGLTATDQIKKLESAVYFIKASATTTSDVKVAWTESDVTGLVTGVVDFYRKAGASATDPATVDFAYAGIEAELATLNGATPTASAANHWCCDWALGSKDDYAALNTSGAAKSAYTDLFKYYSFWTATAGTTEATYQFAWINTESPSGAFVEKDPTLTYKFIPVRSI